MQALFRLWAAPSHKNATHKSFIVNHHVSSNRGQREISYGRAAIQIVHVSRPTFNFCILFCFVLTKLQTTPCNFLLVLCNLSLLHVYTCEVDVNFEVGYKIKNCIWVLKHAVWFTLLQKRSIFLGIEKKVMWYMRFSSHAKNLPRACCVASYIRRYVLVDRKTERGRERVER